jgi:hypothetical protein
MAFVENNSNQLTFDDSFLGLTEREQKFLLKSWAKPFADIIFPAIDEKPFAVLYCDNSASRPNTPVNVIIGLLILKEYLGLTDDEVLESLLFDVRFQYALHTTSYQEQPISDRTLSRFRARCLAYEIETGQDLIKDCITSLSADISAVMGINGNIKRMDSLMVASNIKKLSRLELLYVCVANAVKLLDKKKEVLPESMKHYIEPNDQNKVIYHARSTDVNERIRTVLDDASFLIHKYSDKYKESSEYQLLIRAIGEQTAEDEKGVLHLKEANDKSMNSEMLQNPADPDATFRFKSGKQYRGYVANVVEDVSENGSVITEYDYQANIYSDSKFFKDVIKKIDTQDTPVTLLADGAYGSEENEALASDKNVNLINTNFTGIKPDDFYAEFEFSEDGKKVLKCAGGQTPITCTYYAYLDNCRITLDRDICDKCPYKEQCKPKIYKKKASKTISRKTTERAKKLRYMKKSEFKEFAKIRNGVESIPSTLRRKYQVDKMPVRGKLRTKLFFGFKIAAMNFNKLRDYLKLGDNYAQNKKLCTGWAQ